MPWWGEANPVTLHLMMAHMIAEMREGIDGAAGLSEGSDNLPDVGAEFWSTYWEQLEQIASETQRRTE